MEMSAYFLAVRTVVNREDPVGLLGIGAPEDEYDPEVGDLIKGRKPVTAQQVSTVFLRWFGESGAMGSDMAARIADGINQARARRTRRARRNGEELARISQDLSQELLRHTLVGAQWGPEPGTRTLVSWC